MTCCPKIEPILEEGIDRKLLATLRARFLSLNEARLARALQGQSSRQQLVLRLLPLLFHVNHPLLPGYVSAATPAGLSGFEPDAELLAEAQRLARSFAYKPLRHRPPQQILALFAMGSLGTVAQEEGSDLDIWVCHDPALDQAQLAELTRKCELLQGWAKQQGSEAHFFLIDPQRFASGERQAQLSSDDCGTTQHYLLLDEFYRTALWLGGRIPLWWLVPAYEEYRYGDYVATLLERRFIRAEDVLDLGHLAQVPPGEFAGAALWQLYKALESPYKSLFKLLLTEVYASQHPRVRCLALDYKQAVYDGRLELDELDPYIAAYRAIEGYLAGHADRGRLELARRALYLKINRALSRPPRNRSKSWQRLLAERLTRDWGWDERQFALLDRRSQWKVRQVLQERSALVNELIYGYRFLSDLSRRLDAASPISRRDLSVLERRLQAAIARKAGKVEAVNLGISPDMSEDSLTLLQALDAAGEPSWSLYEGSLTAADCTHFAPLRRMPELLPLLAWGHRNGIVDSGTHISLHPGDSGLSEAELFGILAELRQTFALPLPPVDEQALLDPPQPRQVLLLLNIGLDPFSLLAPQHMPDSAEQSDPLGYASGRENLVLSIDQLVLNSWNEFEVSRHTGPQALAECLRAHLASLPAGGDCGLQVRCFSRNRGQAIARRVADLCLDARRSLATAHRYLVQIRQRFHLFERRGDDVLHTSLADRAALLEHLGEAHPDSQPIHLDRHALKGDDLGLILPLGRADCLQVFYRVRGDIAELSVLDERNALWMQRWPYRDEQRLLMPLLRFLRAMIDRRNAQRSLSSPVRAADSEILLYRIRAEAGQAPQVERRAVPQDEPGDPLYDVQAIVESRENGRSSITLYCNHQEFSGLEYGSRLFAAVAEYILAQRRPGERYPCYITDLDLSGLQGKGRSQTVHYLRYKARLEVALNQALRA